MQLMTLGTVDSTGWQRPQHLRPWYPTQPGAPRGKDSTNIGKMIDSWSNRISESTIPSLPACLEINDFRVVFEQKNILNNFYEIKFHKIRFSTC